MFALALSLRLAFVAWAPGVPDADGRFYHIYARTLLKTGAYQEIDGSPAIRWMPGWPVVLAGIYSAFGDEPKAGMAANAVFDAGAATLLALLGTQLFGRRVGTLAGVLFALWPGEIYYSGTLFTESLFNLLLIASLWRFSRAGAATSRRALRFGAAGALLGLAALVKAEPLTLGPALLLFQWRVRRSPGDFVRAALAAFGVAGALLAPWTLRNYLEFERFIPTSASGGIGAHLANRPGATGGQEFAANLALQRRYRRSTYAETSIARNDAGWRDAWEFARNHPREQLSIVVNKLRITYLGDHQAVRTLRGSGGPEAWRVAGDTYRRLVRAASGYWFAMLALAAVGLSTLGKWRPGTAPLVLGVIVTYLGLHVLLLGGQRYHVPQVHALALLAARGLVPIAAAAAQLPARARDAASRLSRGRPRRAPRADR